ncbi:uncharacterized protein B0I36DRAFT_366977 [Microdochium trichocladiopsis]|uniref:DUF7702 domain-containing protein n=1 Tax=Microdochium trichocladiopsis TaxID=1682393 RepID=A0A9P8XYG1_9PEZI|nr:uncharacterized protein B0I36DRAFT_366977 [Microdochium trichocladiopsis]KAH7025082.1 hypothetical protein B0I36DRAFT_366977 [Microdochium trichocladiopsis]
MASPTLTIAIVELAIYAVLSGVCTYIAIRHGTRGLSAWGSLLMFCALRMVAAGLQIKDGSAETSTLTAFVNAVGICGLMAAISGINLEVSEYLPASEDERKATWACHTLHYVGAVFSTVGGALLASTYPSSNDHDNRYMSDATTHVLMLCTHAVLMLELFTVGAESGFLMYRTSTVSSTTGTTSTSTGNTTPRATSSMASVNTENTTTNDDNNTADKASLDAHEGNDDEQNQTLLKLRLLTLSALAAVPFLFVRLMYGMIAVIDPQDGGGNKSVPVLTAFFGAGALSLVLVFGMQLVACLFLVLGGLASCGMIKIGMGEQGWGEEEGSSDAGGIIDTSSVTVVEV